jgi:hypothetical protein
MGMKYWPLIIREDTMMWFQNRMLRRIFVPNRGEGMRARVNGKKRHFIICTLHSKLLG